MYSFDPQDYDVGCINGAEPYTPEPLNPKPLNSKLCRVHQQRKVQGRVLCCLRPGPLASLEFSGNRV